MLTKKQNVMLTQTGRGTLMGNVMRRYWQPAALSEELLRRLEVSPGPLALNGPVMVTLSM